jgi:phosphate transport system permease protein
MYALSSEGLHIGEGYATAIVLLILVIGINALAAWMAKKITEKQ